jgi:hypothetical protein
MSAPRAAATLAGQSAGNGPDRDTTLAIAGALLLALALAGGAVVGRAAHEVRP